MKELMQLTALELGRAIRRGEVSPGQAVQAALDAIESRDGQLNAWVTVTGERAMEGADRAARADSPLAGVPMGLKDNICTRGVRTTCASRMLADFCPPYDAAVTQRLEGAGAILLGKLNMDEFAMGSTNETSCFGPVKNPWDLSRVSGGSSGGAAAAVAAGECWFALGSDTGGSVRQPAAWCGITGIKPTYGSVSRYGLIAYASSFDQVGPVCRDAADCAAVLDVIQGRDERDSTSRPGNYGHLLDGLNGDIRGMKIGLPTICFAGGLDDGVAGQVLAAAQVLRERGAVVEECRLEGMDWAVSAYYVIACAEASSNLARYDGVRYGWRARGGESLAQLYETTRSRGFGAEAKRRILLGTFVLHADCYDSYYKKALAAREKIKGAYNGLFERYDLLLTPVTRGVAPRLGESMDAPARMYQSDIDTVGANLAGLPALSMPCGFSGGLPVGVQLLGPAFGEGSLLNAAHAFQLETDWHRHRPGCFGKGGGAQ